MLLVITQKLLSYVIRCRILAFLLHAHVYFSCTVSCTMHLLVYDPCIDFRDTSDKFQYCHSSYIIIYPSNPEINPLTTNHFFKLRFNNTITVFPVTCHTFDLPFNNIADHELEPLQQIEDSHHNHVNVDSIINEDKFDHSELAKVDPDVNFLTMKYLRLL